jgi:hypothetical protein
MRWRMFSLWWTNQLRILSAMQNWYINWNSSLQGDINRRLCSRLQIRRVGPTNQPCVLILPCVMCEMQYFSTWLPAMQKRIWTSLLLLQWSMPYRMPFRLLGL